jgi:hypothetical protein
MKKIRELIDAAADHDSNEERRYLAEGRRWALTWSWLWTNFSVGAGVDYERWGGESVSVWIHLGPVTVEVYRLRTPLRGAR